jgi:hypothetical protein
MIEATDGDTDLLARLQPFPAGTIVPYEEPALSVRVPIAPDSAGLSGQDIHELAR